LSDLELSWEGGRLHGALRAVTAAGLEAAAEHLAQVSSRRAPHQEGTLERSAEPSSDGERMVAAVSFDTPYAVRQHEDMALRHDEGRTSKYLEIPMSEERDTMLALIADAARRLDDQ
jgi:hypothetical protein